MGPCTPWVTIADCQSVPSYADLDDDVLADMIDVSSEILYALSGRQFAGVCTDVVRPCARRHGYGGFVYPSWFVPLDSWGSCGCAGPCECGGLSRITLGVYPLREIIEVRIDGAILTPTAYRIDDRRWLARIDGNAWPATQDLTADPLTDPNTFGVWDRWGLAPPISGVLAARYLACELTLAYMGKPTKLPERIQSITRQGVSMVLLDPQEFLDKGRTGIYLVDLFLGAVNPHRLQRRAQVISPDVCKPVTRTASTPGS